MKPIFKASLYLYCALIGSLSVLILPAYSIADASNSEQASITISTSQIDGVQYVSARALVHFTPQYFLTLMSSSHKSCEWMDKCESVKLLEDRVNNEQLIQTHINAPWPFKDRDMVVTSRSEYDSESNILSIFIEDASDQIPPDPKLVRMTDVNGKWQIKPLNGQYELSYTGTAKPNGNIPSTFALSFMQDSTQQTFENLQALNIDELELSASKQSNNK